MANGRLPELKSSGLGLRYNELQPPPYSADLEGLPARNRANAAATAAGTSSLEMRTGPNRIPYRLSDRVPGQDIQDIAPPLDPSVVMHPPLVPPGITREDIFESVRGVPGQPTVGGPPDPLLTTDQILDQMVAPEAEEPALLQPMSTQPLGKQGALPGEKSAEDEFTDHLINWEKDPGKAIGHVLGTVGTSVYNAVFGEDEQLPGERMRQTRQENRAENMRLLQEQSERFKFAATIGETLPMIISEVMRAGPGDEEAVLASLMQQYGPIFEGTDYDIETAIRNGVNSGRTDLNEIFGLIRSMDPTGFMTASATVALQNNDFERLDQIVDFLSMDNLKAAEQEMVAFNPKTGQYKVMSEEHRKLRQTDRPAWDKIYGEDSLMIPQGEVMSNLQSFREAHPEITQKYSTLRARETEELIEIANQIESNDSLVGDYSMMLGFIEEGGLKTGIAQPFLQSVGLWLETIPRLEDQILGKVQAGYGEVFNAMSSIAALRLRNPESGLGLTGNTSDRDLSFLQSAVFGLKQTEEANIILLMVGMAKARRDNEILRAKADYMDRSGRGIAGWEAEKQRLFVDVDDDLGDFDKIDSPAMSRNSIFTPAEWQKIRDLVRRDAAKPPEGDYGEGALGLTPEDLSEASTL